MGWFDTIRQRQAQQQPQGMTAPTGIGASIPTASPATPTGMQPQQAAQPWGGWNSTNVFDSWDLNPLSQQTGVARDDLSQQRDAFLQPIESSYRQAGGIGDANGQNLWADPNFRSYAQTGQIQQPQGQTLAGLGPASSQYPFGSSVAPFTGQFQAPTADQALQTPGLQYAMQRAQQAIERSAAAKGTLLSGGTLRDLSENQIGMALQGYQGAYDRSRGEFDLGRSIFESNQDRPYAKYISLAELGRPAS